MTGSAFAQTIRAAKTFSGQPLPDDLRTIIEKSLAVDPNTRYASIGDMKQVLSSLVHGGNYSASTFNLAFYLSNLLKKELEGEAQERDKEAKVNMAAYAEGNTPAPILAMPSSSTETAPKSRGVLFAVAAGVLVAVAGGAYFLLKPKPAKPVIRAAAPVAAAPKPKIVSQPVVTAASPATATTTLDPAAEKKAFEAAVQQKMQEEMMKLQADLNKQLKQQQSRNAPVQTASMVAPSPSQQQVDDRGSAAALDQRRVTSRQEAPALTQSVAQQAPPPVVTQPSANIPAPQPQASAIREGDVVDVTELDKLPEPLSEIRPAYPPLAAQQRASANIILSALVGEDGRVAEVKILRGDARFGFNDAAIRAMRAVRFTPPIKDGKRVKTWRPQSISFKP